MDVQEYLEKNGIKASVHRMEVMKYLQEKKNHPTVDMIYNDLHQRVPTLSKTTIYNILKLFVERGLTQVLTIDEKNSRYDGDVRFHAHFRCLTCSCVKDIFTEQFPSMEKIKISEICGMQVVEAQLNYYGYCENCRIKTETTKN